MIKLMARKKRSYVKEEDYWVFPLSFLNVLLLAVAFYASVIVFRAPTLILGVLGNLLVYKKLERSYSRGRALFHLCLSVSLSIGLAVWFYFITN